MANPQRPLPFPSANTPRTWLITSAASPVGLTLSRALLAHGDKLVLGVLPEEFKINSDSPRSDDLAQFVEEARGHGWAEKFKIAQLDARYIGQCQTAVAEAVGSFGGLDILFCCASETVVGAVEELTTSERSRTLVKGQIETNFFGPTNIIKAALPAMREKRTGHIIVLTGITSHLGTPGLGIYCAAGWALEGLCDSLAYEIAPYNIKLTIIQPNLEIGVLSNKISTPPQLPQYKNPPHPAPLQRAILGRILDRLGVTAPITSKTKQKERPQPPKHKSSDSKSPKAPSSAATTSTTSASASSPTRARKSSNANAPPPPPLKPSSSSSDSASAPLPSLLTTEHTTIHPSLSPRFLKPLLSETIYAICAIGGHENPPARHIVGNEAVTTVKEKLKTVSEELEDFVECSSGVDIEEKALHAHGSTSANSRDTLKKEREEREHEVGAGNSQNSLVSNVSGSGTEAEGASRGVGGKRGSFASTATASATGRKWSEGSIVASPVTGKRGSFGAASAIDEEMDIDADGAGKETSRERKKGKGVRKKSTGN